jgi:hypothetical protein
MSSWFFTFSAQGLLPGPNLVPVVGANLRPPYPPRPSPQPQSKLIEWQAGPSPGLDSKLGPSGILVRQQPAAPAVQGEATGTVISCRSGLSEGGLLIFCVLSLKLVYDL